MRNTSSDDLTTDRLNSEIIYVISGQNVNEAIEEFKQVFIEKAEAL